MITQEQEQERKGIDIHLPALTNMRKQNIMWGGIFVWSHLIPMGTTNISNEELSKVFKRSKQSIKGYIRDLEDNGLVRRSIINGKRYLTAQNTSKVIDPRLIVTNPLF